MDFNLLTETELEECIKKYGTWFGKAYTKELEKEIDRKERIDELLNKNFERENNEQTRHDRYGHFLDKYMQ